MRMMKMIRYKKRGKLKRSIPFKIILLFVLIAFIHPFIANERPLFCKIDGNTYFPVITKIGSQAGLWKWYKGLDDFGWKDKSYDMRIMPLIPYSYNTIDGRNARYKSPLGPQDIDNRWQRHWLGTDLLGRDVLAGILKGTEIAVKIGFVSVLIAAIIAIFLGLSSAYTIKYPKTMNLFDMVIMLITIPLYIYLFWLISQVGFPRIAIPFLGVTIIAGIYLIVRRKFKVFDKFRKFKIPLDGLLMRCLEAMKSIPGMILILACLSIFQSISVTGLIAILAFIMWPGLTRYVRAEAMKILNMDYITMARSFNVPHFKILLHHVAPKLLASLSVLITFNIASAIIVESTLSFLGIGIPIEQVSWGSLLKEARINFSAWWLAIFPGIALFTLILNLHLLGEQEN